MLAAAGAALNLFAASGRVVAIGCLCRITGDLAAAEEFYCSALGFRRVAHLRETLPTGRASLLALGPSRLQLTQCDTPGAAYHPASADTPGFQHAAIVVADIDAAWAHINAVATVAPITAGGPVLLPGGLRALKFRDPEGHPLELLQFPSGKSRTQWRHAAGLFKGIDHSAITVRATTASLAFWRSTLGMVVCSRSLNHGAPQTALDDVTDPLVRVTQLRPVQPDSMRLELLAYLAPAHHRERAIHAPNDIAADRLVLQVRDLDGMFTRLVRADASFISAGPIPYGDGRALLLADPDGHHLLCRDTPVTPP